MFLAQKEYDIKNFLQALSFIPPKGMSVAYFISPEQVNLPDNSGYVQQTPTPEDESVIYQRQLPIQKQDQAQTPGEYSTFQVGELGRRQPTPNILPEITEPEDLESPFVKVINESKMMGTDIKLLEDYMMFPKNTVFHCVPERIKENKESKYNEKERQMTFKELLKEDDRYGGVPENWGKSNTADYAKNSFPGPHGSGADHDEEEHSKKEESINFENIFRAGKLQEDIDELELDQARHQIDEDVYGSLDGADEGAEWGPGGPNGGGLGVYDDDDDEDDEDFGPFGGMSDYEIEEDDPHGFKAAGLDDDSIGDGSQFDNPDYHGEFGDEIDNPEVDEESFADFDDAMGFADEYEDEDEADWDDGPQMSDDISFDSLEESNLEKAFNKLYEVTEKEKRASNKKRRDAAAEKERKTNPVDHPKESPYAKAEKKRLQQAAKRKKGDLKEATMMGDRFDTDQTAEADIDGIENLMQSIKLHYSEEVNSLINKAYTLMLREFDAMPEFEEL